MTLQSTRITSFNWMLFQLRPTTIVDIKFSDSLELLGSERGWKCLSPFCLRQADGHGRPLADFALHFNRAAVGLSDPFADRQA